MANETGRKRKTDSKVRIIKAAAELFEEYGYEDATLEAIADSAGLHVQTLYRHFEKKHDLAFALMFDNLRHFEEFFAMRTSDSLHAWREWVERNANYVIKQKQALWNSAAIRTSTSYLMYWHQYETVLAEGIAEDMGVEAADDLRPMLIACMLVSSNRHTACEFAKAGKNHRKSHVHALIKVVDTVINEFSPMLVTPKTKKRNA